MLIQCRECKREVSDAAAACPHCGAPQAVFAPLGTDANSLQNGVPVGAPKSVKGLRIWLLAWVCTWAVGILAGLLGGAPSSPTYNGKLPPIFMSRNEICGRTFNGDLNWSCITGGNGFAQSEINVSQFAREQGGQDLPPRSGDELYADALSDRWWDFRDHWSSFWPWLFAPILVAPLAEGISRLAFRRTP